MLWVNTHITYKGYIRKMKPSEALKELKNDELKFILQINGLPTNGKKAGRPCLYNNSIIGYSHDSDDYSTIA